MQYQVTLQIPVQTHDDAIWLFQKRNVMTSCPVFPGMLLTGRGIPQVLPDQTGWASIVREVGEDLDNGIVFVTLQGLREVTYSKDEMLAQLGPGWKCSDDPLARIGKQQPVKQDDEAQGGYDDGYPKSQWDD